MGIAYNPGVIFDGLKICIDFANQKSYPGTGNSVFDISGNGNNGTLINSPLFSSDNFGSMILDGTNDYVTLGTTGVCPPETTISFWIKFPSFNGSYFYINENSLSNPELRLAATGNNKIVYRLYDASTYFYNGEGNNIISTNTWYNLVLCIENSLVNSYINLITDISSSGFTYNGNPTLNASNHILGTQRVGSYGYGGYANVTYGHFTLYNRVLSFAEIKQNYDALRGRFGL